MYPKYEARLSDMIGIMEPFLDMTPIDKLGVKLGIKQAMELGKSVLKVRNEIPEYVQLITAPAEMYLNKWFESDILKGMLATDSIIGAYTSPRIPGSGYVLMHHVMGEVFGQKGVWAYVQGGMGAFS
jgi:phytoene dehydrogenase-like protein